MAAGRVETVWYNVFQGYHTDDPYESDVLSIAKSKTVQSRCNTASEIRSLGFAMFHAAYCCRARGAPGAKCLPNSHAAGLRDASAHLLNSQVVSKS